MPDWQGVIAENRARLENLAQRVARYERALVLATGPSVADYAKFDWLVRIPCGSS